MRFGVILASTALTLVFCHGEQARGGKSKTPAGAGNKVKHLPLHHALFALHHAEEELKESKVDFGGHKVKAEKAIHGAIKSIDAILKHEKDEPARDAKGPMVDHKKITSHPCLHHAVVELKKAHQYVKESKEDFGGHRVRALQDIDHAIHGIDDLLKYASPAEKTKKK